MPAATEATTDIPLPVPGGVVPLTPCLPRPEKACPRPSAQSHRYGADRFAPLLHPLEWSNDELAEVASRPAQPEGIGPHEGSGTRLFLVGEWSVRSRRAEAAACHA